MAIKITSEMLPHGALPVYDTDGKDFYMIKGDGVSVEVIPKGEVNRSIMSPFKISSSDFKGITDAVITRVYRLVLASGSTDGEIIVAILNEGFHDDKVTCTVAIGYWIKQSTRPMISEVHWMPTEIEFLDPVLLKIVAENMVVEDVLTI